MSTQDRTAQKLTLPSGRVLAYAEYGPRTGYPVFFFHGFPSARLEARGLLGHKLANNTPDTQRDPAPDLRQRGLRWIAPDRPGFGLSAFQPGRSILQWPSDVLDIADALNLRDFAILGTSGGGPYALACAHMLPRSRITAVGVLAGGPPWEAGPQLMERYRRVTRWAAVNTPWLLRQIIDVLVGSARWLSRTRYATNRLDAWISSQLTKSDALREMTVQEHREQMLEVLFEGFRQGSAAMVEEAVLLSDRPDWGWRYEDTKNGDKVIFWHGTDDSNSPFAAMKWLADKIKGCELRELKGATHYTSANEIGRILSEFAEEIDTKAKSTKENNGSVESTRVQA